MSFRFTWHSCQVEVGFSFFALLAFCCLFLGEGSSAFFLLAAAFHEAAHIGMMVWLGSPPASVSLTALGCRMTPDTRRLLSYREMAAVSLAGPGMNLLCAAMGLPFLGWEHNFFTTNAVLGILHSFPVEPLDGGLALRALLEAAFSRRTAAQISLVVGLLVLIPLAVLGFVVLLWSRYNFTLLAMAMYLMFYLVLGRDLFL